MPQPKGLYDMKKHLKISILGGDLRQLAVADMLSASYDNINIWGIRESAIRYPSEHHVSEDIGKALDGAKLVILPLPASSDGTSLNCPLYDSTEKPKLLKIAEALPACSAVIGGKIPAEFVFAAQMREVKVFDYFESEDFQIKNAYTTAEAALSIAMNALDKNIRGSRIAITGYGRISKHLSSLLRSIGADVTIAARRDSDISWAESCGCHTLKITPEKKDWLTSLERGYDVIYNTVPSWLFDRDFLSRVDKSTFIVDLASAPGGVDIRASKELGANVSWATSLPGKYAPKSAGELVAECVRKLVKEVDV